jgi:hypothetical protein
LAKPNIPDPMERRHLIERELEPDRSLAIADVYLEAGRASEAVIFLSKAGAEERLEALAGEAVTEGDAFLLAQLAAVLVRPPSADRWTRLAENAEAAGKERYAEMARRHARSSV